MLVDERRERMKMSWRPDGEVHRILTVLCKLRGIVGAVEGHDQCGVVIENLERDAKHFLRGIPTGDAGVHKEVLVLQPVQIARNRRGIRTGQVAKRNRAAEKERQPPAAGVGGAGAAETIGVEAARLIREGHPLARIEGKEEDILRMEATNSIRPVRAQESLIPWFGAVLGGWRKPMRFDFEEEFQTGRVRDHERQQPEQTDERFSRALFQPAESPRNRG